MAKKSKNQKTKQKIWWKSALCIMWGIIFTVLPTLMLLSLFGYDANDPSFNKITNNEVHNFLGIFGSYSADFIWESFGISLIIFLIIPIFWGIGLLRNHTFSDCYMRIFAWFVGMLSLACFFDLACSSYLGYMNLPHSFTGDWSKAISRYFNSYVNNINVKYNTIIFEGIILFVSAISFNYAAGITFKFWLNTAIKISNILKLCIGKIANIVKKLCGIHSFSEFKELHPRYLQSKVRIFSEPRLKIRREPEFGNDKTELSANTQTKDTNVIAFNNKTEPQSSSITIELPQEKQVITAKNDNERAQKTVNPTFSFLEKGDELNKNVKKSTPKITPGDIYGTEGNNAPKVSVPQQNTTPVAAAIPTEDNAAANNPDVFDDITDDINDGFSDNDFLDEPHEYQLPDIELLSKHDDKVVEYDENMLKANAAKLEEVLKDFGIRGQIVKVRPGPVVTLYELEPAPGTRTARVIGLSDDIARSMAAASVRMAVVTGRNTIGIELPNAKRETVWLRELFEDSEFQNSKNILNVALGKDIGGQHVYADLAKMPHLLVAGTTGSGKSVGVNSMILSLLYRMTPEQCKFIMIDPKQLEFSMYNGIPHLLTPVITDPGKAVVGLKWAVREMEDRYRAMALLNVRNIAGYNQKVIDMQNSGKEIKKTIQTGFDKETGRPIYEEQVLDTKPMPYIVIVVDEMADLMLVAGKEVEAAIQRLAQMARAAGIHLIMSTQRPSVDVITGTIKANFPSRISFHVTTKIDSRTILGEQGAEQLLGMGDMLYMPSGLRPVRVHGCFVADNEVERVVEYVKSQGEPRYVSDVTDGELNEKDNGAVFDKGNMSGAGSGSDDELYQQAVEIVRADKKASTSYIQRKLRLGYNRAAVLIERMEDEGIVTPPDRVGRRQVVGAD